MSNVWLESSDEGVDAATSNDVVLKLSHMLDYVHGACLTCVKAERYQPSFWEEKGACGHPSSTDRYHRNCDRSCCDVDPDLGLHVPKP